MSGLPKGGKARELPNEDTHNAVCIQIIDLGTQPSPQWGDKRKCQLAFELVDEQTSEGKSMVVYKQYTFTDSDKGSLMKDLKAWGVKVGEDFDMDSLLGRGAMVTTENKETEKGTFANITNVAGVPKGHKVKKATEPYRSLYLDDNFDQEIFDALPEFLRNKIAGSPEYAQITAPKLKKEKPGKQQAQPAGNKRR
jgi:hypothetical protein